MLIENEFQVGADPEDVYRLMLDVERVAPCIPGAEVTGARDDGGHDARVSVKLGPVSMSYKGSVQIVEHDDDAREATMKAKGTEARGQGTAQATMKMSVTPESGGSRVRVSTDVMITGRVAQMGKGIMQDVATRMLADMARCMETRLQPAAPDAAAGNGAATAVAPDAAAAEDAGTPQPAAAPPVSPPPPPPAAEAKPLRILPLLLGALGDRVKALLGRLRRP